MSNIWEVICKNMKGGSTSPQVYIKIETGQRRISKYFYQK